VLGQALVLAPDVAKGLGEGVDVDDLAVTDDVGLERPHGGLVEGEVAVDGDARSGDEAGLDDEAGNISGTGATDHGQPLWSAGVGVL
jgi:hypothetical protein